MKNIFRIIIFICSFILQAQEGVIAPYKTYTSVPNGTYLKDIENELNPFIGTYIGHWDNKKFTLILQKMEHVTISTSNMCYIYEDVLVGKYEIVKEIDNSLLYSTMDVTDYVDFPINNSGSVNNDQLEFSFYDSAERCENQMQIRLYNMTTLSGVTTVKYWGLGSSYGSFGLECAYANQASIPKVLPYGHLTLTKVD